jgi:hypothetical protein
MADTLFDSVKLLLPFNGAANTTLFADISAEKRSVSVFGDTKHSDIESVHYDTSAIFDGSGDYLTVSNTGFDFHTANYTVDFWVKYPVLPVGKTILSSNYATTSSRVPLFIRNASTLTGTAGSNLVVGYYNGTYYGIVTTFVPEIARWYHIAVTRSGSNLLIFVDGVQVGTFAIVSAIAAATSTEFRIGRRWENASTEYFTGYLQDLRITSGEARYAEAFTPPEEGLFLTAPSFRRAVCDVDGNPASRTVRLYRRDTGVLTATATSDAVTGEFEIVGLNNTAYDIQVLSSGPADGCDVFLSNQTPA